jgi:signal peptidase I
MKTTDKKTVTIFVLLALLIVTGIGLLKAALETSSGNIPYDNTYSWAEFFPGYEAYLDRRIRPAIMSTTSMAPTINVGDTILWVEVDNMAELKVGDIIIFKHPTIPDLDNIAHRIVEIEVVGEEYRFGTKGDNSSSPDQHMVPENNVHGLVIGVIYKSETG